MRAELAREGSARKRIKGKRGGDFVEAEEKGEDRQQKLQDEGTQVLPPTPSCPRALAPAPPGAGSLSSCGCCLVSMETDLGL